MRSLTSGDSSAIKFNENSLYKFINDSNSSTAFTSKQSIEIYKIRNLIGFNRFLNYGQVIISNRHPVQYDNAHTLKKHR